MSEIVIHGPDDHLIGSLSSNPAFTARAHESPDRTDYWYFAPRSRTFASSNGPVIPGWGRMVVLEPAIGQISVVGGRCEAARCTPCRDPEAWQHLRTLVASGAFCTSDELAFRVLCDAKIEHTAIKNAASSIESHIDRLAQFMQERGLSDDHLYLTVESLRKSMASLNRVRMIGEMTSPGSSVEELIHLIASSRRGEPEEHHDGN
jgi:hypothetical protein